MKGLMQNRVTVEEILLRQAEEIAREQSRRNGADIDLAPWGGRFSRGVPKEIHPAQDVGST
jgi:hypothetical protein